MADPASPATLTDGQRVLIEAVVNEIGIKPDQPLIGVRIRGTGHVIQISVPRECIANADS